MTLIHPKYVNWDALVPNYCTVLFLMHTMARTRLPINEPHAKVFQLCLFHSHSEILVKQEEKQTNEKSTENSNLNYVPTLIIAIQ